MITDDKRETFTAALWARHGDDLPHYIAERIGEQVASGDVGGIAIWRDIAARAVELLGGTRQ